MRIISGKYKGRTIKMPQGIRPTQNKVRKAVFDILGNIEGIAFLELFAGSGAVGLEAASAGAAKVVFVEQNSTCLKAIEENLTKLQVAGYDLLAFDVPAAIKILAGTKAEFDIIFLDPPYHESVSKKTLQMLDSYDILAPCGYIVVQHFKKDALPGSLGVLTLFRQERYGDTVLSLYKRREIDVPESNIPGDI
jgi:16S rRNA (guanine966-N2)-methyltransferase